MSTLAGTGSLIRFALRRDRIMLGIWLYALVAFVAATIVGFRDLYPTQASRAGLVASASHNAAFLSLYGPIFGDSLGSMTAWRDAVILAIVAGLLSVFIVIRHTRADEESGRTELVSAAVVGRHAPLAAAVGVAWIANVVTGAAMAAVAVGFGLPAAGSIAFAAEISACGIAFAAVAAVTAQLAAGARAARGLAIGALAVAFVLRAVGDSAGVTGPHWLSWLSPLGWAALSRAFGGARWWVLALPLALTIALTGAAGRLAARRDYDHGLLARRRGPAGAGPALANPLGLAWRLQRGMLYAWLSGAMVYGLIIGSSAHGIGEALGSGQVRRAVLKLGGHTGLTDAYIAALLSFTGLIVAGYAVAAVLRLRSEETSGRAEAVLATGAGRIAWAGTHLAIAAAGTVAITMLIGLGTGLGYASKGGAGASGEIGRLVAAGIAQAPAALVLGGVAASLFGLAPRLSAPVSWSVLGLSVLMLLLGPLLQLSQWLLDISPFTHLPKLPGGPAPALPLVLLSLIALVLSAVGLAGLHRRDIA